MLKWLVHIVQKAKTTSSIWNYFGLKTDDNDVPIPEELELCNKSISANTYLKDNHPDAYAIVQIEKTSTGNASSLTQPTLAQILEKNARYDSKSACAKEISRSIAVFLAKDMQPFCILSRSRASSK